jgi:hypothetical protein
MSIKNLISNNLKPDQNLQVASIEFNDMNTDYEIVDIVYPNIPSIGRTFSIIRYTNIPTIAAQSSLNLDIDITNVNITDPLVFVTYNQLNNPAATMQQIAVSVHSSNASILQVTLRNNHGSIATEPNTFMALNLLITGL